MRERAEEVYRILSEYATEKGNVPLQAAAEICGVSEAAMRNAIETGNCPFAFASKGGARQRAWYIISPVGLWHWYSGEGVRNDR